MKIVWLCPYPINLLYPELQTTRTIHSHASSWIVNLSNELSKNKEIDLNLLTHTSAIPYDQTFSKNNIHFHVIKYSFPFTNKGFPYFLPLNLLTWYRGFHRRALKYIRSINPDIIHAHGTENAFALTACKANYPYLISIQGIISKIYSVEPTFPSLIQSIIEKNTIKETKNFGYRTQFDKDFILKINRNAKIHYLPEAINRVFFEHQWQLNNHKNLLYVGSLNQRKGIEILFKTIPLIKKRHPTVKLIIIGSGTKEYMLRLFKLIEKLNIQTNISLLGSKKAFEIAKYLSQSRIFVLPTFIDNSPNSLAEAMAVGTPSIASKVGGIPTMIDNGVNGILCKTGDSNELADKICMMLDNKNLLNNLSTRAKKLAYKRNFPPLVASKAMMVYNEILNQF